MDPKKLTRILVDRGLVDRFVLDQLLVKLKPTDTLADRLVSDSILSEADLLRAIAQATGTRFISSPRLAELQLSPAVLAMIPLGAAEANCVLPIAFDAGAKALTVVIANPDRLSALDDLPTVGKLDAVVGNVALPAAIRAAIRRVYGVARRGAAKADVSPAGKCSQCSEPYFEDQLECASCGLLLNANAPADDSEARIVRTLLSQPSGLHRIPSRAQVHEGATRRGFALPVTDALIPHVVAGIDIARSLSEFEAFIISFIDGQMTVGELSQASGLMGIEVHSVLASLRERKVLELREAAHGASSVLVPASPAGLAAAAAADAPAPVEPPTPPVPHEPLTPRPAGARRTRARPDPTRNPPVAIAAPPAPAPPPAKAVEPPRHLDPNVQMENSLQSALALERRGQIDGAISVLRIAISRAPNPAPLYNRLALVVLNQRHDPRQAEQLIHKALELEPDNPVYKANLIKVLGYAASNR